LLIFQGLTNVLYLTLWTGALHLAYLSGTRGHRISFIKSEWAALKSGVRNLFTAMGRMNCALALAGGKINYFFLKILPSSNYEEERLLLTYYLSTCLSWSFVMTRFCTLTCITKIM